jgi:hypothetical protein
LFIFNGLTAFSVSRDSTMRLSDRKSPGGGGARQAELGSFKRRLRVRNSEVEVGIGNPH